MLSEKRIDMKSIKKKVIVKNKQGLHARPAAIFVQIANRFDSQITIEKNNETVNGKSIMGILTLEISKGSEIVIEATGCDAKEAISDLERLVTSDE